VKIQELWFATGNKGKLSEVTLLMEKDFPGIQIRSNTEIPSYSAPPENGQTFLDNARIKAKSLKAMKPGLWVMAEDSGLEVEGLGKLPGIHSARYAGPHARDSENVAKLLKMMQIRQVFPRTAGFQCTMVVFTPQGEEWIFTGTLPGEIAKNVKGLHGFGYDPVFIPQGETQTLAELGVAYKNKHSHRARALTAFIEKLKSL
jgi:XTP/dITP diphosphohydrolase